MNPPYLLEWDNRSPFYLCTMERQLNGMLGETPTIWSADTARVMAMILCPLLPFIECFGGFLQVLFLFFKGVLWLDQVERWDDVTLSNQRTLLMKLINCTLYMVVLIRSHLISLWLYQTKCWLILEVRLSTSNWRAQYKDCKSVQGVMNDLVGMHRSLYWYPCWYGVLVLAQMCWYPLWYLHCRWKGGISPIFLTGDG